MSNRDFVKDVLLGVAVGDAIGVPVEFNSRDERKRHPVTEMQAYGTHHQPAGTWSDDSSLTFCLAEMLSVYYNLESLAARFVHWKEDGYWTPHGVMFDIGMATSSAIKNLKEGAPPALAGGTEEGSNGNGSLMRILPLLFYLKDKDIDQRFNITRDVSSLTHRHIRSVIACFIYLEFALEIISGKKQGAAYRATCDLVNGFLQGKEAWNGKEQAVFRRILSGNIFELEEEDVKSSGYVIHTLEAAFWCVLNTRSYEGAVLKAANLGEDTDTTAAVTGGLAGLLYGWQTIPEEWLTVLAKREEIEQLVGKLNAKLK